MRSSKIGQLAKGGSLFALAFAACATPAFAQATSPASDEQAVSADPAVEAQESSDEAPQEDTIVVTGSRIARPEFAFPNPIQSFTSEALEQSGQTNVADFLVESPALIGSTTNIDVAGSNLPNAQLVGVNNLNLRNLGSQRTLVLVNGRRHVASYPGNAAVDVNTIPTSLIESVDVLTGGTSAVYGADGVSGVVNFILKRDFEGIEARGQTGISQRGDSGYRFGSLTMGTNFAQDRGNVAISYEFNETDRFSQRKRLGYGLTGPSHAFVENPDDPDDDPNVPDYVLLSDLRWADSAMNGAVDVDLDFTPDFDGDGNIYDVGSYIPGGLTIGGSSTPRESYYGDFTPYTKRHIINGLASFEISPAVRVFAEGKYVSSDAWTVAQPSYDFYTYLFPDNAFLNDQFDGLAPAGAFVSRDNFDFGIRRYESDRETLRGVLGFDGELGSNLRYEASYTYGQVTSRSTNRNDRISDRYYAALDTVIDPVSGELTCRINLPGQTAIQSFSYNGTVFGTYDDATGFYYGAPVSFNPGECVPLNILGTNAPSEAALDWILADHSDYAKIKQHVVSASLSGDTESFFSLPGGPVGFAVGAEYRKESSLYIPSYESLNALLIDNSPAVRDEGSFDVKEIFGEINLPILSDVRFAKTLSLGGAVRFSDYSTIGSTKTWSVNGVYAPVQDVTFRGTISQAVRAPNISELFGGLSGTYEFIRDPCGPERLAEGTQYREANCAAVLAGLGIDPADFDPAADATSPENSSLLGRSGGNRTLREETAKTWTAGLVLRPRFLRGLTVAADWYDIRLTNAISTATAQDVVDLCVDQPTLENVYCDAITRSSTSGYVSSFLTRPENVASFDTEGLDVNLNYRFVPIENAGTFNLRLIGNYLHKLEYIPTLGAEVDDDRTEPGAPKYQVTADLTWSKGPLSVNYGINWFSKTRRFTKEVTDANPDYVESKYLWYKEKWEHQLFASYDVGENFNIYGGINNLFDTKPDIGAVAYPVSAVGRSFYLGAKVGLGDLFR